VQVVSAILSQVGTPTDGFVLMGGVTWAMTILILFVYRSPEYILGGAAKL
jgi:hypothetical protein